MACNLHIERHLPHKIHEHIARIFLGCRGGPSAIPRRRNTVVKIAQGRLNLRQWRRRIFINIRLFGHVLQEGVGVAAQNRVLHAADPSSGRLDNHNDNVFFVFTVFWNLSVVDRV